MASASTIKHLSDLSLGKDKKSHFALPNLRDFHSAELPYGLSTSNAADISDMLYFLERPYSDVPGYYPDDSVFVVKGSPDLSGEDLGYFDADTLYFPIDSIDDNNACVVYNGNTFSLLDYLSNSSGGSSRIGVRFVGIDTPETNKYRTIPAESVKDKIYTIDIDTALSDTDTYYFDSDTIGSSTDTIDFILVDIDGTDKYCQISEYEKDEKTGKIITYKYIYKVADSISNERGHDISKTLIDLIGNHEVVMVLDHAQLNRKIGDYPVTYDDSKNKTIIGNIAASLSSLYEENHGPYYSGFSNYGQDGYGRFLGCLYVKAEIPLLRNDTKFANISSNIIGEQWINVSKYLLYLYGEDFGIISHDIPLSLGTNPLEESMFNYVSSAFKLWTYDKKTTKTIDLLDNISNESITRQREFQKEILGFDFDSHLKDWTVMIGDCVFLVPPTSIRCITRNSAESVPLIRSRGSAIKELPQSERMIEMTLYFNDEDGINGVPKETSVIPDGEIRRFDEKTLKPTGNTVTYYMNGLRALISMFKLCPFMPIANTYINDKLNVDAVALSALTVSTMPNYPKCIAATLQLMEFNYHAYMSELPLTGDESAETIVNTNIFEKCIDFDALRYYYQKPLYRGNVVSNYAFDSQEYLNLTYGAKTSLQPIKNFGDSSIEFYLPNADYLNKLLQVKIESINNPLKTQYSLTDDAKEWAYELGTLYTPLRQYLQTDEYKELMDFFCNGPVNSKGEHIFSAYSSAFKKSLSLPLGANINYNRFCRACNPDDYETKSKYKYQLSKDNKLLEGYFYNIPVDSHIYWDSNIDDFKTYPLFNMSRMLYDSIFDYLDSYAYHVSVSNGTSDEKAVCSVALNTKQSLSTHLNQIINFAKNVSIDLEENYTSFIDNNGNLILSAAMSANETDGSLNNVSIESSIGYQLIKLCYDTFTRYGRDEDGNIQEFGLPSDVMQNSILSDKQSIDVDSVDTFKFDKYPNEDMLKNLVVTNISSAINNNLSHVYLKALDGYAPQYLGGQDTIIEVSMVTQDSGAAAAINLLPKVCSEYMRNYHHVLTCCPLRINTQLTRLLGVNEVLVETVDVSTVKNQPGLYEINMRLVSMDRSVRNKEALKNLDINNAGARITEGTHNYSVRDYFDIKNKIASAEVYPDLELPTIAELEVNGFNFIKYKIFDSGRVYPDPDFYFIYGSTATNQIIRDILLKNLDNTNGDAPCKSIKYSDYLGGELTVDLTQDGENSQFTVNKNSMNETARNETNLVADSEDAIRNYELYKNLLKLSSGEVKYKYNPKDPLELASFPGLVKTFVYAMNSLSGLNNATTLINIIDNLNVNETWNFSDDIKGVLREPHVSLEQEEILPYTQKYYKLINELIDSSSKIRDINESKIEKTTENTLYSANNSFRNDVIKDIKSNLKSVTDQEKLVAKVIASIADAYSGNIIYYDDDVKVKDNMWQFNCFRGQDKSLIPVMHSDSQNASDTDDEILNYAYSFSPFAIRMYDGNFIKAYFYDVYSEGFGESALVARLRNNKKYFLNPYIMRHQHICYSYQNGDKSYASQYENSKRIVENYKYNILYSSEHMAIEAVINFYMYFLMLVKQDLLISTYQIMADLSKDSAAFDQILSSISDENNNVTVYADKNFEKFVSEEEYKKSPDSYKGYEPYNTTPYIAQELLNSQSELATLIDEYHAEKKEVRENDKNLKGFVTSVVERANEIKSQLTDYSDKLYKANFIIAALIYIDGFEGDLFDAIVKRDYARLNDFLVSSAVAYSAPTKNAVTYKFIMSLCGREVIDSIENLGSSDYTASDFASGIINEYAIIEETNDPYTYTRDSFYDMITSDMRGRMARAFPTFYLLFVDEGREIGWWQLNDNFYNMSSINEITVTKSRKIAADTCTISMTNMFKTFTTDDEDSKEMSYDLETLTTFDTGIKDVWDSIWSPRKLFLRDYHERLEQNPIDRAQLKPGARIHVRMGYGSDAYSLPCVFNGVVAEVSTGEVVNIVCQGDGVELSNPILDGLTESDDITNYERTNILWARTILNILQKGATPKEILTTFLTAKGRGVEKLINQFSHGRFFDDNPFGISHFGDPDFTTIWGNSECSQNIYEAISTPAFNSDDTYCTQLQYLYNTSEAPRVSTHVYGKSYWDIMNVMASISPDYIASIAPFGMRSTIFYGLPHNYYAYEYVKENEIITDEETGVEYNSPVLREKRKPFQQCHIYTSYSDIIENNITASSKYMKTNAVGIYYQDGVLNNETVKKVGPLFADIDIYSEYQKSMTVDTTFLAHGLSIPIVGDIIPFLNSLTTNLGWFGNDDEKIAWRITARALKDAVKEMYQGELITIGDPSVKPYDIAHITDIYENIGGACEVEAVTHILSSQTGFTSSIYIDPMIDIDNRYYQTMHSVLLDTVKNVVSGYSSVFLTSLALSRNTQPFTKLATFALGNLTSGTSDSVSAILKFLPVDDKYADTATKWIQNLDVLGNSDIQLRYKKLESAIGKITKQKLDLTKLDFTNKSGLYSVLDNMVDIQNIEISALENFFISDEYLNALKKEKSVINKYNDIYTAIKTDVGRVSALKNTSNIDNLKSIVDAVKEIDGLAENTDDIIAGAYKTLTSDINPNNINKHVNAIKTIFDNVEPEKVASIADTVRDSAAAFNTAVDGVKLANKSNDISQALVAATYAARATNPILLIASIVAEILIEAIIVGTVNNGISRFLRNLETLRIYPLTKHGKVFTAGLSGSKGIVVGSSTYDQQGWLQNTIIDIIDNPVVNFVGSFFLDTATMQTITDSWKNNNGMLASDENVSSATYKMSQLLSSVSAGMYNPQFSIQNRIKALSIADAESDQDAYDATVAYKAYYIDRDSLLFTDQLDSFITLDDFKDSINRSYGIDLSDYDRITDSLVYFYHELSDFNEGNTVDVKYQNNVISLPYYEPIPDDWNHSIDIPILSRDVCNILSEIMDNIHAQHPSFLSDDSEQIRMCIANALITNDLTTWHSTGYACTFFIENVPDEEIESIFTLLQTAFPGLFEYYAGASVPGGYTLYSLIVYPPLNNSAVGDNLMITNE